MVTLEMLRQQPAYARIVARREWRREPARALHLQKPHHAAGHGRHRPRGSPAPARLFPGVPRGRQPQWQGRRRRVRPRVAQAQLGAVLPGTDILIVSLPGTPETRHMLSAAGPGAVAGWRRCSSTSAAAASWTKRRWKGNCAPAVCRQRWTYLRKSPLPAGSPLWGLPQPVHHAAHIGQHDAALHRSAHRGAVFGRTLKTTAPAAR